MAEVSGITGSFAAAPQSFTNRDRGPDLRDGRQQTSQFATQSAPQNNTVDARNDTTRATEVVQAVNSTSDLNAARRQTEVPREQESVREDAREVSEANESASSVDRAVNALDQQLQRRAVDQSASSGNTPLQAQASGNNTPASAPNVGAGNEALAAAGERDRLASDNSQSTSSVQSTSNPVQTNSIQEQITRTTAEDTLGLNINTSG